MKMNDKQSANECGQNSNKGVTMATSHGSPPLGTCHTDLSVENKEHKRTYPRPEYRSFKEPRGRWEGLNKMQKAAMQLQASHEGKTLGNGLNTHAQSDHLLTTGNLPVNYDY